MCGIVGYIGKQQAAPIILDGLSALEYRGYDSAGIAAIVAHGSGKKTAAATLIKQAGRVQGLIDAVHDSKLSTSLAIGHTRWATHGAPTSGNAHPHTNSDQTIFVVHNGIIENHSQLRAKLQAKGYKFVTETDTEVIPHLIDYYLKSLGSFEAAFKAALLDCRGAYAIAAVTTHEPDTLYAARLSSPLVIGVGKNEHILASDPSAIMAHTKKVIYLDDYDVAVITKNKVAVHNLKKGRPTVHKAELLDYDAGEALLGDYPNFMLKEIYEAPATIRSATLGRILADQGIIKLGGLENVAQQLKYIDRVVIVACGTASYAGLLGEYYLEEIAGIPAEVQQASEFIYRNEPFSRSTALLAVSQSGETADTLSSLKKVKDYGVLELGVVNAVGSSIARATDAGVYCHAGPEQAVASTKAFIAQVTVLLLISLYLSEGRTPLYKPLLKELDVLPSKAQLVLDQNENIKYANSRDFLFIGRGYNYPLALEGALKLKEISYIHAEGYASGEMKHGPLAMIDKDFPTFAIATNSQLLDKTMSNIQEIRARKGPVIAIATVGNKHIQDLANDVIYVPESLEQTQPILNAIVMQLFAYHIAVARGFDVDKPRNLAKSVTVE
jgi:glucosamine--fructose-6-phosphate aminotransferase (isomerizing)